MRVSSVNALSFKALKWNPPKLEKQVPAETVAALKAIAAIYPKDIVIKAKGEVFVELYAGQINPVTSQKIVTRARLDKPDQIIEAARRLVPHRNEPDQAVA